MPKFKKQADFRNQMVGWGVILEPDGLWGGGLSGHSVFLFTTIKFRPMIPHPPKKENHRMARKIKIYSTGTCPRCDKSKQLLTKWGISYIEVRIDQSQKGLKEMLKRTNNARTVPQIFLGDDHIGGLDELTEAHMDGELEGIR